MPNKHFPWNPAFDTHTGFTTCAACHMLLVIRVYHSKLHQWRELVAPITPVLGIPHVCPMQEGATIP